MGGGREGAVAQHLRGGAMKARPLGVEPLPLDDRFRAGEPYRAGEAHADERQYAPTPGERQQ